MVAATELRGRSRWNWLRSAARRIQRHPRQNAAQIIVLGRLLLQVKAVVGHGNLRSWLIAHFPASYATAREAMRAAKLLENDIASVRHFGPSAIRLLTKPRMSKTIREKLLKSPPREGPKKIGFTRALLLTLEDDGQLEEPAGDAVERMTDQERAYSQLQELLTRSGMVHFIHDRDAEFPDESTVSVTVYSRDARAPRTITRRGLPNALAAAIGQEPRRFCTKCKTDRPVEWFAKRTHLCRLCERKRVGAAKAKKRAGKKLTDKYLQATL